MNFISSQVSFVLSYFYKSTSSCLCHDKNGKLLSSWALTSYKYPRIENTRLQCLSHSTTYIYFETCLDCSDSLRFLQSCHPCVASKKNRKKFYFGSTYFIEKSLLLHGRPNILVGNLWQLMTASKLMVVCAPRHNRLRGQFSKSQGLSASVSLPFFPTPYLLFYSRYFSCGLWLLFLVVCSESAQNHLLCRLM